ncbi:uncharacterized protein LOC113305442 [Papaver somniferum]|uniref:uncharacterized protein LOC113305442 n=1 Tax=Papaver somniferum TaxID=3469 RepID=UPI000E6F6902|nr:uncharacterized protein LOC113305442 [Papaver somniferum]
MKIRNAQNTIYEIENENGNLVATQEEISEVIVQHFKSKFTFSEQGDFIKGKTIQEKIILASEMVKEMETTRRGGNVAMKINISQTFDSLSWESIFEAMKRVGFSDRSLCWLKILFSSARISVLVNGRPE